VISAGAAVKVEQNEKEYKTDEDDEDCHQILEEEASSSN
jgi:hypothetical protein